MPPDLDLRANGLGPGGLVEAAEALTGNTSLRRLSLGANGLTAADATALGRVLGRHPTLTALHLDGNPLGDGGAVPIAEAAKLPFCIVLLDCSSRAKSEE